MTSISQDILDDIVVRLVKRCQPEKIILFGSYAYGSPTDDSDLDLLIVVSESDEPQYRRAQKAYGAMWGVKLPTELLVLTRDEVEASAQVKSSLVHQALHHGSVLYGQRDQT
ncbi:hypothetical protein XM38_040540 [Halomicronema hongdechloris C2206]|uniref:Polymerase nucleotidyl transferase domain-containing protein n=1 Tax=Halomicronema hongdechloris C2206 TaxID=1641165 RepID=A0A1Z3HS55_9CYAN|nr:nucleotidyltransferase domain-containing protein [Halomicronema hongdechloris]ASC73092.1 hypothetical protein XM38_040540 [Halomicronema hongdechloris C2206]